MLSACCLFHSHGWGLGSARVVACGSEGRRGREGRMQTNYKFISEGNACVCKGGIFSHVTNLPL